MNEFDYVGISDVHLMQQTADQTLDLAKVAQQTIFFFWLGALGACGTTNALQQTVGVAALGFLVFCR